MIGVNNKINLKEGILQMKLLNLEKNNMVFNLLGHDNHEGLWGLQTMNKTFVMLLNITINLPLVIKIDNHKIS